MGTRIYVAVNKDQVFGTDESCLISYVGLSQQIINDILRDGNNIDDYNFYKIDTSVKYEVEMDLVKVEV